MRLRSRFWPGAPGRPGAPLPPPRPRSTGSSMVRSTVRPFSFSALSPARTTSSGASPSAGGAVGAAVAAGAGGPAGGGVGVCGAEAGAGPFGPRAAGAGFIFLGWAAGAATTGVAGAGAGAATGAACMAGAGCACTGGGVGATGAGAGGGAGVRAGITRPRASSSILPTTFGPCRRLAPVSIRSGAGRWGAACALAAARDASSLREASWRRRVASAFSSIAAPPPNSLLSRRNCSSLRRAFGFLSTWSPRVVKKPCARSRETFNSRETLPILYPFSSDI